MTTDFGRMITAMVTPFNDDLTINLNLAKKLAAHLVETGSDGLLIAGTSGESPTLSRKEKLDLFNAVLEEVGDKAAVLAGTGNYSTADSIALTQEAEKIGVHATLLVAPYYNKPSQEGLFQHYRAIAESTNLPVILYNIPGRSSVNILPETVIRLAAIKNIVAIKEAAGNLEQFSELKRSLPEDFAVYCGDDSLTLPTLALGGKGIISVASHLVGRRIKEMINAYVDHNTDLATQIHLELFPIFKGLFIATNPAPVKAALNMKGWPVGGLRLPMVEITAAEKEALRALLANLD